MPKWRERRKDRSCWIRKSSLERVPIVRVEWRGSMDAIIWVAVNVEKPFVGIANWLGQEEIIQTAKIHVSNQIIYMNI